MKCLFLAAGLVLALSACDRPHEGYLGAMAPRHPTNELRFNNGAEPEWLDPGKCSDTTGGELIENLFSGLVAAHPETLQPVPEIAESWTVSPDGRTYTFNLRESVWSDGRRLTAHDFVWSWMRVLDPATASKNAALLYAIRGAEAFNRGKGPASDVAVRALDDRTLQAELASPVPYFLHLVSYFPFLPVPRHVLEDLGRRGVPEDNWTRPEHIVSNGAFVMKEWRFRQYILFEKNARYWDVALTRLDRVRALEVTQPNTAFNLYVTGDLDWSGRNGQLPTELMDRLPRYKDLHRGPYLAVYMFWLNVQRPPLDRLRVRQALSLALDREALVKYVLRAGQIPSADVVPDGLAGYRALGSPIFDPVRARALLAEEGFPGGKGLPTITFTYNTGEGHKQIAEAVQQMWKQNLNLDVELENLEWKVLLQTLNDMNFQIGRTSWIADYPDPLAFLEIFSGESGNNHSNWKSPAFDRLLSEAGRESDPAARMEILRESEKVIASEVPVIPVYVFTRSYLVKPYVKGLWPNHQDRHPWKYIWIDAKGGG